MHKCHERDTSSPFSQFAVCEIQFSEHLLKVNVRIILDCIVTRQKSLHLYELMAKLSHVAHTACSHLCPLPSRAEEK